MNDVRSTYRQTTDREKALIEEIKTKGQEYLDLLKAQPPSRELSLAITNAEQSVMWAVKGITV